MLRIALDAMGADQGCEPLVLGASQFVAEFQDVEVQLVGDPAAIRAALRVAQCTSRRLRICEADGIVEMTDSPAEALRSKPNASIARAVSLVAEGTAEALVSAGNTGAVIVAAAQHFRRLEGVRRVGLAAVYPTVERHGPMADPFALMLDVGATLHATAQDLVAFAALGSCYSRVVSGIERPRVALLSNGSEPHKGTAAIVKAHAALAQMKSLNFVGNVEGLDIPRGNVDVVVCEGFVGNIVLKMLEGVSEVARDLAKTAAESRFRYKLALGMLASGIRRVRSLTDWKQYGGAPILGFDRTVIKAHGRSNARAIRNALRVAQKTVEAKMSEATAKAMGEATDLLDERDPA